MTHRDLPHFANLRDGGNLPDADLGQAIRTLRLMRNACLIALVALMAVIAADRITRGWNEAIHSSLTFEVIK